MQKIALSLAKNAPSHDTRIDNRRYDAYNRATEQTVRKIAHRKETADADVL